MCAIIFTMFTSFFQIYIRTSRFNSITSTVEVTANSGETVTCFSVQVSRSGETVISQSAFYGGKCSSKKKSSSIHRTRTGINEFTWNKNQLWHQWKQFSSRTHSGEHQKDCFWKDTLPLLY